MAEKGQSSRLPPAKDKIIGSPGTAIDAGKKIPLNGVPFSANPGSKKKKLSRKKKTRKVSSQNTSQIGDVIQGDFHVPVTLIQLTPIDEENGDNLAIEEEGSVKESRRVSTRSIVRMSSQVTNEFWERTSKRIAKESVQQEEKSTAQGESAARVLSLEITPVTTGQQS